MKKFLIFVYIIIPVYIFAQSSDSLFTPKAIKDFGDYLFEQKDYLRAAMELERYLYMVGEDDDSTLFKIGLCHQLRGRYDFAVKAFLQIVNKNSSNLNSTSRRAVFYNLSKLEKWEDIKSLSYKNDEEFVFYYLADVMLDAVPKDREYFQSIHEDSLKDQLLELENYRQNLKKISPLLASTLSALIPGLGKVYINRTGDALFSFTMINLAAFVSYKAFKSALYISGVITSGITLSFYLGTVYGSYIGAKLHNQQIYHDWRELLEKLNPVNKEPYWRLWVSE